MEELMDNSGIKVEFSKVSDGNMSFVWGNEADVIKNRQHFLEKNFFDAGSVSYISLEHGKKIHKVDTRIANVLDSTRQDELVGDGLYANRPGTALMLVVADCIPAALYDPLGGQLCVLHAGRKGVELNILSEAVAMMKPKDPKQLVLIAGPAISSESYVFDSGDGVDTDFWGDDFSFGDDKKYHMDIKNKFKNQAIDLGLSENNVDISKINTYLDQNYYSHRRSMKTGEAEGRFAIIASLS
jgi:YfiH family protein